MDCMESECSNNSILEAGNRRTKKKIILHLHRRTNAAHNNLVATFKDLSWWVEAFLAVKDRWHDRRMQANEVLEKHNLLWRFPLSWKRRTPTVQGNDARKFITDPDLLAELMPIFYGHATVGLDAPANKRGACLRCTLPKP